jgi:beta-ureidopropionase / N-carbamoyl-L-amino-acid hydrolase
MSVSGVPVKAEPARANMNVDGDRLWKSLMEMARIGATPKGGVNRLALTDLDRESRDLFIQWCKAAGLTITIDAMGNIFGRRAGRRNDLPPVMAGSHLDTQPTGGKFDGAYGVMAALEVVRTLNDLGIETEHPIEIVSWTNEEGSRFSPAMTASGVFAGAMPLETAYAIADRDGKTMGEELARIGYRGDAPMGKPVHAYFEPHIEQGPYLEEDGKTIGVVTSAMGQKWYEVTVTGFESHAGPTPMHRRRDALVGAARMIELVNAIGHEHHPAAHATVGMITVEPASRNVIPGQAWFTVDLRSPSDDVLALMDQELKDGCAEIAQRSSVDVAITPFWEFAVQPFDAGLVAAVRRAAADFGYSHRDIASGAGHDAVFMARVAPSAMIFVPCEKGISHNELENAKPEDLTAGCNVLLSAVLGAAGAVTG